MPLGENPKVLFVSTQYSKCTGKQKEMLGNNPDNLSSLQGLNSTFSSFRLWLLLPSGGSLLPVRLLLCLPLSALSR